MSGLATLLFLLAALGGITMAVMRLRGRELPPTNLALAHGGLAVAALVVYVVALATAESAPAVGIWATVLFVVAALGGAALFVGFHRRDRALPMGFVLTHGGIAVLALILLLFAVLGTGATVADPTGGGGGGGGGGY